MKRIPYLLFFCFVVQWVWGQSPRTAIAFNDNWKFLLNDTPGAEQPAFSDASWRTLELPHDWSIELPFDKESPTGTGGGALRGGTGWYRKTFTLPATAKNKKLFIDFDGVYMNSEVWINGHSLGKRPNGYIGFRYDLTPHVKSGKNVIAVKVNNAQQPNSRWYSGSGIYRNVWLVTTNETAIDHWGTYITTPQVSPQQATLVIQTRLINNKKPLTVKTIIRDKTVQSNIAADQASLTQTLTISNPQLWSVDNPHLYKAVTQLISNGQVIDEYTTTFGIRTFHFDIDKGFFLNGSHIKIRGVCNHHDLGCLGTAVDKSALRRQLQILKAMGCNGIRTSHNPPAPELLDLCDEMGFIVMDEAFDMWKKEKNKYDYHLYWDEWHERDLRDQLLRDRNHPSVFMWSIGNEIGEQWGDSSGRAIVRELTSIVKSLDPTRAVVVANNATEARNQLMQPGVLDMIGFNYHHNEWLADTVFNRFGRKPFIVTESVSALQTRGHYDMPSDSIRRWPKRWDLPVENANPDTTCSAYDNCSAPWGSTHEETIRVFEKYDHISGMYIWTGFDYIGEPTPYPWPARSSYFGIIDLAGFPKDVYYLYQSVWTNKPVLHVFPHWNWKTGDTVDVWAYYNNADEVELFANEQSKGIRKKQNDEYHVMWRLPYTPGTVRVESRKNGKTVLTKSVQTAGAPARIELSTENGSIHNGELAFVKVRILDQQNNLVPNAANLVQFTVKGGKVVGVDNGSQTSMESFKANHRKAFNGLCLAVLKHDKQNKFIQITAESQGLKPATKTITVK